jgi:hypothetical protein
MSNQRSICPEPPDLVKRFVPTPISANVQFAGVNAFVETNDPAILDGLREFEGRPSAPGKRFVCRFIRDENVRAPLADPTVIHQDPVLFLSMGPSCLIAIDCETRELFGFLGSAVEPSEFRGAVLPLLRELMEHAVGTSPEQSKQNREFLTMGGQNA